MANNVGGRLERDDDWGRMWSGEWRCDSRKDLLVAMGPGGIAVAKAGPRACGPGYCFHASGFYSNATLFASVAALSMILFAAIAPVFQLVFSCAAVIRNRLKAIAETRAHMRAHLCRTCGYNLTGNVSGVCPECGTAIENESKEPDSPDTPTAT